MSKLNTPRVDCDLLKVNLAIAAGIGDLAGSASRNGALRLALSQTQDNTLAALDPRDCSNKIYKVGGDYGVTLEYWLDDCAPLTDTSADFDCSLGETAAPTSTTQDFTITKTAGFNITLTEQDWLDTCCGTEEYYREVADIITRGENTSGAMQDIINRSMSNFGSFDREYNAKLISKKIQRHMNAPITGTLAVMNDYILDKLAASSGYNPVSDIVTGDPVGNATWSLPVLYSQGVSCPTAAKRVDSATFKREFTRFYRANPNCQDGFSIIGGRKFEEMFDDLGILSCCDSNGVDKDAELRSALGFLSKLYIDDTIDDKVGFGEGTFFIVEDNVLSLFWFNLYNDPRYYTGNKFLVTQAAGDKWVEKVQGYRDAGTTPFTVGDCRDGYTILEFDTFFNTPQTLACLENPVFNFQFRAKWDLFIKQSGGCAADSPRSGIYRGILTDICV
jgi:hypothetical protein